MENRCEKCDGELLEGVLAGLHGLSFYPKGEKDKLVNPKQSSVVCFCCKSCGCFNVSSVLLITFIFKKEVKMKIYVILASLF